MNTVSDRGLTGRAPSAAALEMIERLIAFNTVSHESNLGLIEWARDYLQALGATTRLTYDAAGRKANLFATLGEGRRPGLILSGHTDVVPVEGQDWHSDPFQATIRDGRLYGRGSADMKGFIGIALAKAPLFLEAIGRGTLDSAMHYSLSYDEEVGCLGVRGLIRDLEEIGLKPAGCIVGEPTNMQPIIGHKGTHRMRCTVRGREAHSSYVTHGVNAIEYAARLIVFIRHVADEMAALETRDYGFSVPYSTLSVGTIKGGIAANVVPKQCDFQFDMRTLPQAAPMAIYERIQKHAEALAQEMKALDEESGIELVYASGTDGLNASEEDAIVQFAMRLAGENATGKVSYGTEAGLFQKAGIPTVICGPGDIAEAHRPDEYATLEQLARCETFLERVAAAPAFTD